MPLFPVVNIVSRFRHVLETNPNMIAKLLADIKTAADTLAASGTAVNVVSAEVSQIAAMFTGTPPTVGESGGFSTDCPNMCEPSGEVSGVFSRQSFMIERVKRLAEKRVRTEGYSGTDNPITVPNPSFSIAAIWPTAAAAGAEQLITEHLSGIDGYSEMVGASGKILDFLKNIGAWIIAHGPQEIAIVEDLLKFLSMLALL